LRAVRGVSALTVLLLPLAACGRDEPPPPARAERPFAVGRVEPGAECSSPATDSTRAVCVALKAATQVGRPEPRVVEVVRQGDVYCVRTSPAAATPAPGGGTTVRVDREGRIRTLLQTDSSRSCADLPPLRGDSTG
jgi:hypothetical protein